MQTVLRRSAVPAAVLILAASLPATAQELARDRLRLLPAQVEFGTESTRLLGMGGFSTAVRDDNIEISLWDFSHNPAGYSEDRDSWALEVDYNHQEFAERDRRQVGNDIFVNEGTLAGGYHAPGEFGLGAEVDYAEVEGRTFREDSDQIDVLNLEAAGNRYLAPGFSLGLNLGYGTESENSFNRTIYNISHEARTLRGGIGAAYAPVSGVVVGGRFEGISANVDGLSRGDFHEDAFEWSRPAYLYSLHGFVNRGRLSLGVDATGRSASGRESVRVSWSDRFVFNPGDEFLVDELNTISEDRSEFLFKSRVLVGVGSGVELAASVLSGSESFQVVTNPNIIGSRTEQDVEVDVSRFVVGGTWTGLRNRLLLAAEGAFGSTKVTDQTAGIENNLDQTTLRVGGEYFLSEIFTGRVGLSLGARDLALEDNPDLDGTFNDTTLSAGLGVVPAGGIWQFDIALSTNLSSDLENKNTVFGSYIKYLF